MKIDIKSAIIGKAALTAAAFMAAAAPMVLTSCSDEEEIPMMEEVTPLPDWDDQVNGDVYDYSVTMEPERPYMHDYSQSMMMKLFMARPKSDDTPNVNLTMEDALEIIKRIDNLTRGVHKIVYLVGWQYAGHDWKYPAFHDFNEALKRPEDATAKDSFYWLQDEAEKYNTTVSVHINVHDAEQNSPLWHTYVKNDFLCKTASGTFYTRGTLNGLPMYNVNIVKEWQKGMLQKRLTELADLVRLDKTKTLHCDAFYARESPYHGTTVEQVEVVMRKMLRYMRDKEVDVTIEFLDNDERIDPMIGLNPASWWLDINCEQRAKLPATLIAGGKSGKFNSFWEQEAFLFGDNYQLENDFNYIDNNVSKNIENSFKKARQGICLYTIPYMYFNRHKVEAYDNDKQTVTYSDGLKSDYKNQTVTQNGVTLRDHNNIFFPLLWITDHKEIMAYSVNGYNRKTWTLPADWAGADHVTVYTISESGLGEPQEVSVTNGTIQLSLEPNEMLSIQIPN